MQDLSPFHRTAMMLPCHIGLDALSPLLISIHLC